MASKRPRSGTAQRYLRPQPSTSTPNPLPHPTPSPAQPLYQYSSLDPFPDPSSPSSSIPSSARSSIPSFPSFPSDRASLLRASNSYLSSLSPPIHLKPPLPPARDILDALHRLFSRLDLDSPLPDLTRDLPSLLSALHCPFKLSKSALRAPSTPHAWPSVISVLYWLVQLARVADHLLSSPTAPLSKNHLLMYLAEAYHFYMSGDDSAIVDLDAQFFDRAEREAESAARKSEALEADAGRLEEKLRDLASTPTPLEALEVERLALLEDVKKFQSVVDKFGSIIEEKKERLVERENVLDAREAEKRRLDEENAELRQRIRGQAVSTRDVERMTRELQAVEREVSDAERRRNETDEKAWLLNPEVEREFREIEISTEQCNQAIKKLKIENYIQHVHNPVATSAAEVIGTEYKTILKPALGALTEEAMKSKVVKVEELINMQKQSHENDLMLDGKRAHCTTIQTKINEIEAQNDHFKKEIEEHVLICSSEAEKTQKEFAVKQQEVDALERSGQELLMDSEVILKKTTVECIEETQLGTQELYALIDSLSKYKEFMTSTISGIKDDTNEVTGAVKLALRPLLDVV